ncbi:UPF0149 family protein [Hydrogenophaga sp. 5NK40-0174]|uniref:UPF0149 family protein n=1 Tax=Hydrogenophaga sp. 5NK40-0174 TaxID=3127649 RepID=UPI0031064FB7
MTEPVQTSNQDDNAFNENDTQEIDDILDALRKRDEETPQWEFLDGAMAALICTRRPVGPDEYLPLLLEVGDGGINQFDDEAQKERFMALWNKRWNEVSQNLDNVVENLSDDGCYQPEISDVKGALLSLPPEEREDVSDEEIPAFAQVWALGFMFVVENWEEEWVSPRDKEAAEWLDQALSQIVALTEDDTGTPEHNLFEEEGEPTVSDERMNQWAAAVWAVYDLRQLWKTLGPRVDPARKADLPGRNDPCWCGSGKKFKKCHGAA